MSKKMVSIPEDTCEQAIDLLKHRTTRERRRMARPKKINGNGAIHIERGIPVPKHWAREYPFDEMEVGDSFVWKGKRSTMSSALSMWKARHPGWDYAMRTVDDGFRIWRIA